MRRLVSLMCLLLAPLPAAAEIVWKSGFEMGDRSEWSSTQMVDVSRLMVVQDVAREGKRSLKATVIQGDNPIKASGNRNEIIKMTREESGSEYWYRWSVRFGKDFPSEKTWQLFTQWHHEGNTGSPPVEFYVYGEEVRLNIGGNPGRIVWRTALKRGVWLDFVFRVRWSPDPKLGLVELYLDGKQVLAPLPIPTQYAGQRNYLKAGLYRNDTIKGVGHLYLDDFVIATRQVDVMPLPVPAGTVGAKADAGTASLAVVDAGTPKPPADASAPRPVDAGVASPGTQGGSVDAGRKEPASVPTAGTALPKPRADASETPTTRGGGCSAGAGDLVIPGALLLYAALGFMTRTA